MGKILLLFFTLSFYPLSGQVSTITWDYPIKIGSDKWKSTKSYKEKVEICQIPEDVINKLSTENLAKICLDYPLFFSLTAFNNMQQGFEQVSTEFNGFGELYHRRDVGKVLLELYHNLNPEDVILFSTDLDKGRFMFKILYLEFMLAQNNVFLNLRSSDLKQLIIESSQKSKLKQKRGYSNFQLQTSYLVMARLFGFVKYSKFLERYALNPKRYDTFMNNVILPDQEILNEIDIIAIDYINQ